MPGISWLHGTRGSNVFLVEADDGQLALIDTGFASSSSAILDELREVGRPLAAILITHHHRDHSGAAEAIRAATGATVCAARADCVEQDGTVFLRQSVGRSHLARYVLATVRRRRLRPALAIDRAFEGDDELLPGIRAVAVPGHTPGSVCYVVDRLGAAFVGDLVISHEGTLTRALRMANHDDAQYLESIRRFGVVAPEVGLPGHGTPLLSGFGEALRELGGLPRRPMGVATLRERVTRLRRFGRGMSQPRRPA